jgi:hypothetical protein
MKKGRDQDGLSLCFGFRLKGLHNCVTMIVIGELIRIANMEADRLPRMMIGSHMKRLNGEQARSGDVVTERSNLLSTIEEAGLWTKGSGGDLNE